MSKVFTRVGLAFATLCLVLLSPVLAHAAEGAPQVDGKGLGLIWVVPFVGMLLSIAIMPLATPQFWHHHFGKVAAFWSLAFVVPFALTQGFGVALYEVLHTLVLEYIPFILLLFALFTVAGGVRIKGNLRGSPVLNTSFLAAGTIAAGWMGTTGASMLLIRPMLRANDNRQHNVHVVIFFIFLVANIGGSMTPLGDPPLFLGFLKGVDFFWPTIHLALPTLLCAVVLLAVFFAYDTYLFRKEGVKHPDPTPYEPAGIEGGINILLLGGIVVAVLLSGVWNPGIKLTIFYIEIELQNVVRDILLIAVALLSLKLTKKESRAANGFSWGPILEVAKLFIGIFLTIIPAIAILRAGSEGSLSGIVSLVTRPDGSPDNAMYFWITGILSSFLDNAPTYLIFFNTAGGDAAKLMGPLAGTLIAVSAGAVFMGANTYIGNAPNFMVKSIAEENGVKMPSFFGYMAWSCGILVPLFVVVTLIFF
jgi:Na+/H+ antiporter NhaD/arsenite permease-like protein